MFASRGHRRRLREWVLWGVPLSMVAVAGLLIASTQRQADYADWYHHWITAGLGVFLALNNLREERNHSLNAFGNEIRSKIILQYF